MGLSTESVLLSFIGGLLIGLAALLMLYFNGRIMGISGIIGGLFHSKTRSEFWRLSFFLGILVGGVLIRLLKPNSLVNTLTPSNLQLVLAGVLVGWGTRLGSGCTSGHGICGVSRLSPRSLVATGVFMISGMLTVRILFSLGVFS